MKESVTYQAVVEEGMVRGEVKGMLRARQDDLFQLGRRRVGSPSMEAEAALRGITDPDRLARMIGALLDVSSWDEFAGNAVTHEKAIAS